MDQVKLNRFLALALAILILLTTSFTTANILFNEESISIQNSLIDQNKLIFSDDFENFKVGSFPSQGGWVIDYDGAGLSEQYVTDQYAYSGSKSLRLLGTLGWAAVVERHINYSSRIIGYNVKVYIPKYGDTEANAKIGFFHLHAGGPRWNGDAFYAWIWFTSEGYIIAQNGDHFERISKYEINKWYEINAIYDTIQRNYTLWVNGEKKGEFYVDPKIDPDTPNAISLQSGWASIPVFYDDINIFEGSKISQVFYINSLPYTIVVPGKYILNVDWHGPYYESETAITIKSNHVILDGNNHSLIGNDSYDTIGIAISKNYNITIKNIKLLNNYIGIKITNSRNINIINNEIINNIEGIYLENSIKNKIQNNIIKNSDIYGIYFVYYSNNNNISNNIFKNNDVGIFFDFSNKNNISLNQIINNDCGFCFDYSNNNSIYLNNFINNSYQIDNNNAQNYFDNGKTGNYWSDYIGSDENGDGIGDYPYIIDENNIDHYPLMSPINIKELTIKISKPSIIPLNRIFTLNVSLINNLNQKIYITVDLNERVGFQAGPYYGDGDEVRNVVLGPYGSCSLSFIARIYGVSRTSDKAIFKIYINNKLYKLIEENLSITPEFIRIPTLVFPTSVLKGSSFSIYVPLPYSFTRPTRVDVILENIINGKVLEHTYTLLGNETEVAVFNVDKAFSSTDKIGEKNFRIIINVRYPEEDNDIAYTLSKEFSVYVTEKTSSSSIILTNIYFKLRLNDETYYAILAYNASVNNTESTSSYYDAVNEKYSIQNWLIFKYDSNNVSLLSPVMNDTLYEKLALAAEAAMLRSTVWTSENLEDMYEYFSDVENLAREAEGILWVIKLLGLTANTIIMGGLAADIPITFGGVTLLTAEQALTLYKALSFYEIFDDALNKASNLDKVPYWLGVDSLTLGKIDLGNANEFLVGIEPGSTVDVAEALKFVDKYILGRAKGFAGIFILGTYMDDKWKGFKEGILELVGVSGAYEFYEALKDKLGLQVFLEYSKYMLDAINRYNIWKEAVMNHSIDFRNAYLNSIENSIRVNVMEPKGQHTILAEVIDDKGRKAGADPSGVKCEIPGSYVLKYDEGISIIIPLNATIEKINIYSVNSTELVEKYNITVSTYLHNELKGNCEKSGKIKANTNKVYNININKDLKPIIYEKTVYSIFYSQQSLLVMLVVGLTIISLIITIFYKRKKYNYL